MLKTFFFPYPHLLKRRTQRQQIKHQGINTHAVDEQNDRMQAHLETNVIATETENACSCSKLLRH